MQFWSWETRNVFPYRYRYVKETGGTSLANISKNVYQDHDWECSDEGAVSMHDDGFGGNIGVELDDNGIEAAIVEAAKLFINNRREQSMFVIEKISNSLHNFSMSAEDYTLNLQNYELCETAVKIYDRANLTSRNGKKEKICHKYNEKDSDQIF